MEKIVRIDDITYVLETQNSMVVTFKLEEDLLTMVDETLRKLGYSSRSDFIRHAIEEYIKYLRGGNSK
ncbi:ribbon-helix-helix domain-containing protein [Sulfolobus tengchongensis]|uniref:Ribbon-helix-helix domain-containing protein n=1 Tax=Sulfolobus tengchongensis TaxID=207809 RepID=A0AAX4L422_9CREN